MIAQYGKRALSLLLALVMIFSAVPMQVFAEETHDHEDEGIVVTSDTVEDPTETPSEPTPSEPTPSEPTPSEPTPSEPAPSEPGESEAMIALRAEIAAYLENLGITPDMPDVMLLYAYGNHASYEEAQASLTKQDEFVEKGMLLSEEEQKILLAEQNTKLALRYRDVVEKAYETEMLAECTVNGVKFATTSTNSSVSNSGSVVTATVKATSKKNNCGGTDYTANTMVLYITNTSDVDGTVFFKMEQTNVNSIKVGDEDIKDKTNYRKALAAGEEFAISVTTAANGDENKVVFSDITFTSASQAFTVTVEYPTANGSVTSSVAGESADVAGTTTITIPEINAVDGVTLTANSGTFLCWVDKDNKFLSADKAYKILPSADTTVKAVMTGGNAHFLVNGKVVNNKISEGLIYGDLNAAVQMAKTASNKTVVLMNNGTLPAGTYTIPSGVTLLIPYDSANTLCTTAPTTADAGFSAPTVYRKLTMAEGANITVNGALSLSAKQAASGGLSSPIGACSFIEMSSGSTITVNNGGNLYAWGYIQGSGAVTVENGGTVYECFQVMDWRGGTNALDLIGNSYGVFPFSQYYVQNVEVPMTLKAGAIEKGYMSVNITLAGIVASPVPFIGSDGMFNIKSGHIVKDYDEKTGRLVIDVHGELGVQSLTITMDLGFVLGTKRINSKDYALPINGNITVTMCSGGSINMTQDIALQPGARLIIAEGATCTLGDGNKIYVYDYDQWTTEVAADAVGEGPSFCGTLDATHINLKYPTSAADVKGRTDDAYVEVNGMADLSAGYVYTTASGANICGTGTIVMKPGKDSVTYQVKSIGSENKTAKWIEIPITSAQLQNADGTVTVTADDNGTVTYKSVNGVWTCQHDNEEKVIVAATCEAAGEKTLTCKGCGYSQTVEIPALGHNYEAKVTAPTCTEAGYTTHTCKNDASHTYTDTPVAALGHTEVVDKAVAPTCTATGLTEGKHCSVCNKVLAAQEEVAALGHTAGAAATCTTGQTCTVCGAELVAKLGHTEVVDKAVASTCTATGLTEGKHCSVCGETLVAQKVVAATGHTEVVDEAVAPTCTETGLTRGKHCSVCNEVLVAQEEVAALGHNEKSHNAKAPTCTEIGWDAYVTCSRCDYTTYVEKEALDHDRISHNAKAPTCTEIGWDAYETCSRCDHTTYVEKEELGHNYKSVVTAPTCMEDGYTTHTCENCGDTYTDSVVRHPGHKWEWITDKAATVLESGIKHEECSVCHEKQHENTEIPMLKCAHTDTLTITEAKAATCTEVGNSLYSYCSACQNYYSDRSGQHEIEKDSWVIEAKGHTDAIDAAVAPTCTATGLTEGKHCSVCGETLVAQTVVPNLGHSSEVLMAVAPTCTATGLTEGSACVTCGETLVAQEEIPALGHTEVIDAAKAADCDNSGLTEGKRCSVCGHVITAQEVVPALGHTYVEHEDHVFHCDRCGDTFVQGITEIVGTVTEESSEEEISQAVEKIQNMETEQLKAVMQDETAGKDVVKQIEKLENHVDTQVNVSVKTNASYKPGNVSVIGAKLNKVENETRDITLWIGAVKNDVQIPDEDYNVRSAVKFSMTLENVQNTENLAVPVQIKLPVPESLDAEKLVVLHFNADGTLKEAINPAISEDEGQKYATFVLSSFCDFALAENHKHAYKEVVTAPTCTAAGFTTYTCDCGDTYTGAEVATTDHNYQAAVTYPAGVVKGYTVYTCSGCGDSYRTEWLDAAAYKGKTIAAVGDSITAGVGVTKDQNDYVKLLADQLGMSYIRLGVSGTTLATDGGRVCNIDQLTEEKLNGADVVTIAMGINDFANAAEGKFELGNINSTDTATIYGAAKMWCERIAELKKTDTLRDTQFYFVTPVITSWKNSTVRNWDQYEPNDNGYTLRDLCNAIIEVAACYNVAVIDLNLLSGMYYVDAQDNNVAEFGGDGVHPGAGGHAMMADALAKALLQSDLRDDHDHVYGSFITTTWAYCNDGMKHQVCSVCGHVSEGVKISAVGHDEVQHEGKAPTCTETGWEAYVTCSRCDYTTKIDLPVNPEGHVWDEGESYKNHSCNSASYIRYKCTLCEETKLVVDREQHFRVPIAEKIPATCTESGMTSGWKCEKCDEFWIPQEVIPALGHDWKDGKHPCENDSSECTRCDVKFDSKQEHMIVVDPAVSATCTETGLTEGSHCAYCGMTVKAQEETPVAEHSWIVAETKIDATCGTVGHKEGAKYCLICDYDENAIPMLEHEWMHRDAKKATYSAIGWNAHDYCLLCKTTRTLEQYEGKPCEFCGENPEEYKEIPKVEIQQITSFEEYLANLGYLEMMAEQYAKEHPGTDPLGLVLNYLRTAVANYTSGSWAIMAGPEDKDFLKFVQTAEDAINSNPDVDVWVNVSGLKKIKNYKSPTGEKNLYNKNTLNVISGHLYGTMDMTYHNKGSQNHADVGGWVGDLTDLLSTSDEYGVSANLTLEEKIAYINKNYLFKENVAGAAGSFGSSDLYADLDGYYFMNELITKGYKTGDLAKLMGEYYTSNLTLKQRFAYLMNNRLDGLSTRQDLRTAVYNTYTSNKLITTLEGTRNFKASGNELAELRKAVCYAFADEMCRHAGDYVEDLSNDRFTIFDSETKILAPGISQQINYATNADGKQIVYYVATGDVTRDDVNLWVNYYDRDPGTPEAPIWKNNSVPSSAQNAQDRYGDPTSEDYIENFNVIVSTNAGGYDMSDVATPGGLMVMNGVEWYPQSGTAGFFAILDDGTAYMGTHDEYESMMAAGRIKEAIGGFGEFVVKDGKVVGNTTYSDAPRTSVGITSTGRVVIMCIDGRQAPFSSGASLQDVGYIMKEAGCVVAINLDGGGSTTFVARQPGSDDLTIMNRPSDGYPRNVSSTLLIYSTAPSSTKFDHAVIESEYDYATINTPVQMTAAGVSPAGNAVDIPEGATWAVSDENWGSITENGIFTGKRLGEVYVYLMLDGQTIGSKLMTMTNPDQLYFERGKVDAIYGSSVKLPLRARYEGKNIAINPNDVSFTLSAPKAGTMDGFTFQVAESATKSLTITAAIGDDMKASINVMLYKQGENSFDFDKATGGDRNLAWHREVSNSKLEDSNIYNVIDPNKDMVTSYTFAMDMTTIPIPERISELTYMLPGGTLEGATAWSFLLSLAQRISDMSWVKATIDFDDRFNVDYSELKILNDYFTMKEMTFDEETNTLSVTMNWIKQSQVIDEATANPLCLISGFKLTPKAGVWEDVSKINAVTSGNISYEIYMRASGLYGFAQKPESQAVFGIYPYRNPADTSDAGGYFRDTYAEITDTYTLVNVLKEGWVNEDGGFAYYVEGERLTGVQQVEGFYYDFGEKGVNVGQTKLTGLFYDEAAKVYRYSYLGGLATDWQSINGDWYYFSEYKAVSGTQKVGIITYKFEETGKLISGVWVNTLTGVRYYYGPDFYSDGWKQIDGNMYYFDGAGNRTTGYKYLQRYDNLAKKLWYDLGEDGIARPMPDGMYTAEDGRVYYILDGSNQVGMYKVGEDYYFFNKIGSYATGEYYVWETHCDLPCKTYYFAEDGKMLVNGIFEIEGTRYYFERGIGKEAGLIEVDGNYYFARTNGEIATGDYYVWKGNGILKNGTYRFDETGRLLGLKNVAGKLVSGEIVEIDGVRYYYANGKGVEAGVVLVDGNYYFARTNGVLAIGDYYVWKGNGILSDGMYKFAEDGRLIGRTQVDNADVYGEIIEVDGVRYYYRNGKPVEAGLVEVNGDYYFARTNGVLATGDYYVWKGNGILSDGTYTFDADGRLLGLKKVGDQLVAGEIVEKDNVLYYYRSGRATEAGLVEVDGNYYFSRTNGVLAIGDYYVWKGNGILANGTYRFDETGRLLGLKNVDGQLVYGEICDIDGTLYYYRSGKGRDDGVIEIDGYYYNAGSNGKLSVGSGYVSKGNGIVDTGTFMFDEDGRMFGIKKVDGQIVYGEVVEIDGVLYYYSSGKGREHGVIKIDGYYYNSGTNGKLSVGSSYVSKGNGIVNAGTYTFDEDGKMLGIKIVDGKTVLGAVYEVDGVKRYYEKGRAVEAGLIEIDGYYYNARANGILATGSYYVWKGNGIMANGTYRFDEDGKMLGVRVVDGKEICGDIVTVDGALYYYSRGKGVEAGLMYIDGHYYFARTGGQLVVGTKYYVWKTNDLLIEKSYTFNELGQIIR